MDLIFEGMVKAFQLLASLDPEVLVKLRRHQIMALARYARAPLLGWDDVDVTEVRAWYDELKELMKLESAASKTMENA